MENARELKSIPDDELLRRLSELLRQSRRVEADLVAHIGEVDERRLYAREASPSMFAYCTEVLHLSEAEAYLRIAAARAWREHPMLLTMLGDGRLHLTAIAKLAPHLTSGNREALLRRAAHQSKREIEELVAELAPRPDARTVMRKLPQRRARTELTSAFELRPAGVAPPSSWIHPDGGDTPAIELRPDGVNGPERRPDSAPTPGHGPWMVAAAPRTVPTPTRCASVEPLAPSRYKVQFTASAELHDKLERLQALMRSSVPDGDLATIIRAGRHREARKARSTALCQDQGSQKEPRPGRHRAVIAPHPGRGEACRSRAGWRPMPLRGRAGPTLHGARPARVPSRASLRPWR